MWLACVCVSAVFQWSKPCRKAEENQYHTWCELTWDWIVPTIWTLFDLERDVCTVHWIFSPHNYRPVETCSLHPIFGAVNTFGLHNTICMLPLNDVTTTRSSIHFAERPLAIVWFFGVLPSADREPSTSSMAQRTYQFSSAYATLTKGKKFRKNS